MCRLGLGTLVLGDLIAWRELDIPRPEILYGRTFNQEEVDFVIERRGRSLPIEVKATSRPSWGVIATPWWRVL